MAAAYAATCRRALPFRARVGGPNRFESRPISNLVKINGKRRLIADTLAFLRRLEEQGVPTKEAEAIKEALTEVMNDCYEEISRSLVLKPEMQKTVMRKDSDTTKFITEITCAEKHHYSLLQHELEKLKSDVEKMHSELRYEMEKVKAAQRLDLNLEKGRNRDELNNQKQGTRILTDKIDREIHELQAQMQAAKYDVIKYCIGALASISAVGLAVLRILK